MSTTYLRTVTIRDDRPGMRRKSPRSARAGVVHYCPACGWESAPCTTLAATRKAPPHECTGSQGGSR